MTNNKTKLAEVLFSTDAPKDLILWALSNLPDTNENGNFSKNPNRKINHEEPSLYTALGMSEKEWDESSDKLSKYTILSLQESKCDSETICILKDKINNNDEVMTLLLAKYIQQCRNEIILQIADGMRKNLIESLGKSTRKKRK